MSNGCCDCKVNVRAELRLAELLGKPIVMKSGVREDKKPLAIQDKKPLVIKEQDMIQRRMNRYSGFEKVQDYIAQVNGEIEDMLLEHTPIPWLPSSPESESPPKLAPVYREPLPGTVPNESGMIRIGTFVNPPKKRARGKTTPTPWMEFTEADAATIQPQIQASEQENSFAADEEAALHLAT